MHLAMCERCFEHGGNYVFDFLRPFIWLNWSQRSLINLVVVQIICVYFWTLLINNIFLLHLNLNPCWPPSILFSHSWHRTWIFLMIVLCFYVWRSVLFNQIFCCRKFHVHSWTIITSDFCCCTLTLFLSHHH